MAYPREDFFFPDSNNNVEELLYLNYNDEKEVFLQKVDGYYKAKAPTDYLGTPWVGSLLCTNRNTAYVSHHTHLGVYSAPQT